MNVSVCLVPAEKTRPIGADGGVGHAPVQRPDHTAIQGVVQLHECLAAHDDEIMLHGELEQLPIDPKKGSSTTFRVTEKNL